MIEDELYRSSTQYRKWSFTPAQLAEQRKETNEYAAAKVRAAFQRARASTTSAKENGDEATADADMETLTVEEELTIVNWGCGKIEEMGTALRLPKGLIATAMQYLRRFYLTNSPMTYHPKSITACTLFIATKSSHFFIKPINFIENLNGITVDDLKAPEFLVLQGLQFTLDVRHPFMGLDGGWVEIREMIEEGRLSGGRGEEVDEKRALEAVRHAKGLLRREAQMTDVYFLYTPSQIWLGALWAVDQELAEMYLEAKLGDVFSSSAGNNGSVEGADAMESKSATTPNSLTPQQADAMKQKILHTIQQCAEMLKSWKSPEDDKKERKELGRIGKKLMKCQDPEKADIVAVARTKMAEKREGSESEREEKAKKRKLEQEMVKRDADVFGGDLREVGGKGANGA
ncbi:Cyclin CCL1 [Cyphellophora attinorum]|uniref:RNA polymerase II holoenzyme cyclin-like subunit n=1 Tax=Cyphellophora attinorum TaxID=1664694 RepID=A0A0N1P154_9EURO|nr:Cyclin CCL1 [Phialophora attinorum]KPI41525.1 Cyclin CCL1 [Phialophora attinorum]